MLQVHNDGLHQRCHMTLLVSLFETLRNLLLAAWCESGTRIPGPGTSRLRTWDPPQSLKVGLRTHLKFNSGTQDPIQNSKVKLQEALRSLKVGPPHISLMNSFFSEYFIAFFYFFIFVSLLNKIYTKKYQLWVTDINSQN